MNLVVYSMEGCPFCEKLKCLLYEKNIAFAEIHAPPGTEAWEEMREKTGGGSLPQVLVKDRPIGGYAELTGLEATGELYEMLGLIPMRPHPPLYDVIILGGGPAGLSAAIYTIRKLMKTLVISRDLGGQMTWTREIENYLGFSHIDAAELIERFDQHVKRFGVETVIGEDVSVVDLATRVKKVTLRDGRSFLGKTLIIATGGRHKPLRIPGERDLTGRGVSYCSTCDAPLYRDADVAVIGGGNSALCAVLDLVNIGKKIYLVSLTPLTADPIYQEKVMQAENVTVFTEYLPVRILGEGMVQGLEIKSLVTGEIEVLAVEGVFVEIGILPSSGLFIDTLACNQKGEILVDAECRTGVAGVFACGDVTNVPFKQVVVAVGEGAKAGLSAYSFLVNQR